MGSVEPKPSDSLKSPEKIGPTSEPQPSDGISDVNHHPSWCTETPKKLSNPHRRTKYQHYSGPTPQLPEKYEMLLRFSDALDASLKLLRLRKSVPIFTKIRAMVESMSERRFTYQHLAQLKFLLPEEIGVKRVLLPDEETRCMKYDLHVTLKANMMTSTKKRKRASKEYCLKDLVLSRLLEFQRNYPEGAEIPEEELPEPFNGQKQDLLLNTREKCSSFSYVQKYSDVDVAFQPAQASHFSLSFRRHFSNRDSSNKSRNSLRSPSKSLALSPLTCISIQKEQKPFADNETPPELTATKPALETPKRCRMNREGISVTSPVTPIKSAGTPTRFMAATPALATPKRCTTSPVDSVAMSPCKIAGRPSCCRSLQFDSPSSVDVELQVDEAGCPNVLDILPENLLQSLKEKEEKRTEQTRRKQTVTKLPKLFERTYFLFQSLKASVISKKALIHELTECHDDITDESEVEVQLKLMQEIIPEWIFTKLSPSGNILYSINKALSPNILRQRLEEAM